MFLVADEALSRHGGSWSEAFDELVDLEGDGSWCGRVAGWLAFSVERERIHLHGAVEGDVPRECDLCLGHYLEPVTATVAEVCVVGGVPFDPAVFDEDAEVWRVAAEGRLSVTELVRQAVLLALPTRAVCGAGCPARARAAAPEAGERAVDPRLAVLRRLIDPEVEDDGGPKAKD